MLGIPGQGGKVQEQIDLNCMSVLEKERECSSRVVGKVGGELDSNIGFLTNITSTKSRKLQFVPCVSMLYHFNVRK